MKRGCHINGKSLRHRWTDEERTVLALLYKFYDNSHEERLRVWNHMHKEILTAEGYPSTGYSLSAMRSQVADLENGGAGSASWNNVMKLPLSRSRNSFANHKESIEEAAQYLRITLRLSLETPERDLAPAEKSAPRTTVTKPQTSRPPHPVVKATADEWDASSSENEGHGAPCVVPKKIYNATLIESFTFQSGAQTATNDLPITEARSRQQADQYFNVGRPQDRPNLVTKDSNGPGSPRQPILLFRAYLPAHGFRARKFLLNTNTVPSPPPMASETFLEMVDPHLRDYLPENATYLSPFISLAESPERALKRIVNSQLPLSFVVFDSNLMAQDGVARYGSLCKPYPYLVRSITKKHELNDLPGRYTGVGEYLAWGSIECEPIAIIDNDTAKGLHRAMATVKRRGMGWEAGELVGQFVEPVSDNWKETFVYKLLRAFEVPGYKRGPRGESYDDLIDAVYAVNRGDRAQSVFSEAAEVTPTKTRIVVEIPVPARARSKKGKEKEKEADIEWQAIDDEHSGRQVSVAFPKPGTIDQAEFQSASASEDADDMQEMIDAQLQSDGMEYGLTVDSESPASSLGPHTPPDVFLQQLQEQAALLTPPPFPTRGYNASPFEDPTETKETSDTMIIDLCDEEEEADDELRELPSFDLTEDRDNNIEEEDCSIIAAATRRGGGRMHSALSIRSRSLSNAINTPTRPPKRGRGGKVNTR